MIVNFHLLHRLRGILKGFFELYRVISRSITSASFLRGLEGRSSFSLPSRRFCGFIGGVDVIFRGSKLLHFTFNPCELILIHCCHYFLTPSIYHICDVHNLLSDCLLELVGFTNKGIEFVCHNLFEATLALVLLNSQMKVFCKLL